MRCMRTLILLTGLFASCFACGSSEPEATGESWPLHVKAPGVLAYLAVSAPAESVAQAFESTVSWRPAGLSEEASLTILILDKLVFGHEFTLLLPLVDEQAFRDSLTNSAAVREVGEDRWGFSLPSSHPFLQVLNIARRGISGPPSVGEMLAAASEPVPAEWETGLVIDQGYAILAPSYEAGVVAKQVLGEVPGLGQDKAPMVLSVHASRIQLAYKEEIEGAVNQARSMLLGVQMAGMGAMLAAMANDGDSGQVGGLPIPGPAIWSLLEMLSLKDVEGFQLMLDIPQGGERLMSALSAVGDGESAAGPGFDDEGWADASNMELRTAWADGSALSRVLTATRPARARREATVFAFDPQLFPSAVSEWARPLVELTMGEGEPAERLMARIAELFTPCEGTVVVGLEEGAGALAFAVQPDRELDIDGAAEVLQLFARTLKLDSLDSAPELWDVEAHDSGLVPSGRYWQADDTFFLTLGECTDAGLAQLADQVADAVIAGAPEGGPFFSVQYNEASMNLFQQYGELILELPLGGLFDQNVVQSMEPAGRGELRSQAAPDGDAEPAAGR